MHLKLLILAFFVFNLLYLPTNVAAQEKKLSSKKISIEINKYRKKNKLKTTKEHKILCNLAKYRVKELKEEFENNQLHKGIEERNLPFWSAEIMAHNTSEKEVVKWWLNSKTHKKIIKSDYKYSCSKCHNNYCLVLFSNLEYKEQANKKNIIFYANYPLELI